MDLEVAASYGQAGFTTEGLGQQPTHKTFDPNCVLPARCAGTTIHQRLREWPNRTIPQARTKSLTLLMILCYACLQELSVPVLGELHPGAD